MKGTKLKEKLHDLIDSGDEKLLNLMYALAKEYTNEDEECNIVAEDIALFEQRTRNRKNGVSATHTWEEAKAIIKQGKER